MRRASLAAIRRPEAWNRADAVGAHGLIHGTLQLRVRRRQDHAIYPNLGMAEHIVNVPVVAPSAPHVPPHTTPEPARCPAGVHVDARWEVKPPLPPDRHADIDREPQPELVHAGIRPAFQRWIKYPLRSTAATGAGPGFPRVELHAMHSCLQPTQNRRSGEQHVADTVKGTSYPHEPSPETTVRFSGPAFISVSATGQPVIIGASRALR